jgi:hypothetical protein
MFKVADQLILTLHLIKLLSFDLAKRLGKIAAMQYNN